jgi:hypothetical protein
MVTTAIVPVNPLQVKTLLFGTFDSHLHAKRLSSLSDSVLGALTNHSLQPSKMGDGLAEAKGLLPKHARKLIFHRFNRHLFVKLIFSNEEVFYEEASQRVYSRIQRRSS